jgi:hypothetical protein
MSTPEITGRLSSELAARTTCRSASANSLATNVTASPAPDVSPSAGNGSRGNSSAGRIRTANCERPDVIRTSSSPDSNVTAPGSSARTISATRRAGSTETPSVMPLTAASTWIVRSRSLPARRS